jgi:hypothetical protein
VNDLYAARSPADATAFRTRLDRRLHDRYHDPVVWETASPAACRSTGLR